MEEITPPDPSKKNSKLSMLEKRKLLDAARIEAENELKILQEKYNLKKGNWIDHVIT